MNRQTRRAAGHRGPIDLAAARPLGTPAQVQLAPVHDPLTRDTIDHAGEAIHTAIMLHAAIDLAIATTTRRQRRNPAEFAQRIASAVGQVAGHYRGIVAANAAQQQQAEAEQAAAATEPDESTT